MRGEALGPGLWISSRPPMLTLSPFTNPANIYNIEKKKKLVGISGKKIFEKHIVGQGHVPST